MITQSTIRRDKTQRAAIVIDTKKQLFKKSISQIQNLIYDELYGDNWHVNEVNEFEQQLMKFRMTKSKDEEEEEHEAFMRNQR